MSETAKKLFESLSLIRDGAQAMAPSMQEILSQTGAEFSRLGTQGSMELASALFSGQAFVPYGPGQYTPSPEHAQDHDQEQVHAREEHGLER